MRKSALTAIVAAVSLSFLTSAYATGEPQGCTPGYWKNHTDAWITYESYHSVMDVLVFPPELYNEFAGVTIHQALSLKGGPGIEGAARILVRHSIAALLNVRHPDILYPIGKGEVKGLVNDAMASLNREHMLTIASFLMTQNELGCPLD